MANKYSASRQVIILAIMGLVVGLYLVLRGITMADSFTEYDDALNLFSIDYPSNFHVVSRTIENLTLSVDFRPKKEGSSEFLSIMVYPDEPDMYLTKSNNKLQEMVGDPSVELEKYYPARGDIGDNHYFLFRPNEEDAKPYNVYIYYLSENNFTILVMYFVEGHPDPRDSVLKHIFYSLKWSPVKVAKQLK